MINLIIIILYLFIILKYNSNKETFQENNELSIIYYDNQLLVMIFKLLLNLNDDYMYNYSDNQIIQDIYNKKYDLGIVDEITFLNTYKKLKDKTRLKYVASFSSQTLTFISHQHMNISSSIKLNNKLIGVVRNSKDDTMLKSYLEYTNKINTIIYFDTKQELFQEFIDMKIHIIFLIISHPSKEIIDLKNKIKIDFIDCSYDFNNEVLKYFYPFLRKNYIFYDGDENKSSTLSIRSLVISNKQTNKWKIYNFLYNIYINFNFIHEKSNNIYKNTIHIDNMTYIYNQELYHPGSLLFYKYIGKIKKQKISYISI